LGVDGPNGVGDKQGEAGVLATRGKRAPWLGVSTGEGATTSGSRGGGVGGGTAAAAAAVGVDPTYEESGGSVGRGLQGVSLPVAAAATPVASTRASPSTSSDGNTVSRGGNRGDKERGGPDNTGCPAPPPMLAATHPVPMAPQIQSLHLSVLSRCGSSRRQRRAVGVL